MLAGAGVAGHLFLIALSALVVIALGGKIGYGWSALIASVVWAIVAAVLAARGKKEPTKIPPPLEKTQQSLKEDPQSAHHRAGRADREAEPLHRGPPPGRRGQGQRRRGARPP